MRMRNVVLLDLKIDKDEALALLDDYGEFIKEHTGIDCTWYVERRDFSVVPTMADSDGDLKPTREYRKAVEADVFKRYNTYGADNIIMWVHEDNFLFKGVWGVNWSGNFHKYSFQLCRWDKDNSANTFGTLYHEQMHSFDWVIKDELGIDIDGKFQGDWDSKVVHGRGNWDYIRHKENTKALKQISGYLNRAYVSRKEKHDVYMAKQMTIIKLLQSVVKLLGLWKTREDSIPKK
jgi:hypothetical protein